MLLRSRAFPSMHLLPVDAFVGRFSLKGAMNAAVNSLESDHMQEAAKSLLGSGDQVRVNCANTPNAVTVPPDQVLLTLEQWKGHEAVQGMVSTLRTWDIESQVGMNSLATWPT
jgi:hypothetical protein